MVRERQEGEFVKHNWPHIDILIISIQLNRNRCCCKIELITISIIDSRTVQIKYLTLHVLRILLQVYKTPFQRITYRTYEGTGTSSNLELYPHSQMLQDVYNSPVKMLNSFDILCEVSILHVYHKSVQKRIVFTAAPNTTVSPNLLGLDGSKRGRGDGGDPDNSPLTGGVTTMGPTTTNLKLTTVALLVGLVCCRQLMRCGLSL